MASATSSSQRDWGKVRGSWALEGPAALCPPVATHTALLSVSEWTGHGVCGPHQGVHHRAVQPLRSHPGHPRGHHVEVPSPGMCRCRALWLSQRALAFQQPFCRGGPPQGQEARLGFTPGPSLIWLGLWPSGTEGSLNRSDVFALKGQTLALKAGVRAVELFCSVWSTYLSVDSQVSESGVHRPHVAGIHGRSNHGAYSLVLAGGYEDDVVSMGSWFHLCVTVANTRNRKLNHRNYF